MKCLFCNKEAELKEGACASCRETVKQNCESRKDFCVECEEVKK